ncbi:MAG TPA: glycoside hydrolase family 36 protein [Acidimicrobiales bacterium]|nr:glycoside hydrolase family 36 protein [Acidimicrobiales bacterium]
MSDPLAPLEIVVNGVAAPFREGVVAVGAVEVEVRATDDGAGRRYELTLRNAGRDEVALERGGILFASTAETVLETGYQSWSVIRRARLDDVRPERLELGDWERGCHVADPSVAGRHVAGDQYLVTDGGAVGFLDARSHLSTVVAAPGSLLATALLDGVPLAPGAQRRLDPLWVAAGDPGARYSELAERWGREAGARVNGPAPLGWCSWYQYFSNVTPEHVRANLALAAAHDFEVVQIDDGYQAAIGDWLSTTDEWSIGMAAMAKEIRSAGLVAGIWTAPFLATDGSRLLADHPDWTATHASGHPAKAMYNPGNWGGWARALDTTRPEVLDHLRVTFAALRDQGFDYHKIDFCYAAALEARRHDPTKTRAESLRMGLEAVRDGIGDDAFLLGCGCPFGPAVGIVDAMRVSADVGPWWDPPASRPGIAETAPAAVNAIAASVLRAPLHRRLFVNDPDCLLLRPTDTGLEAWQRSFLASVITGTGSFTLVSDDLALWTDAEWALLDAIRSVHHDVDTPLDIVDPFADPLVVRSQVGTSLTVDWRSDAPGGPVAQLGIS